MLNAKDYLKEHHMTIFATILLLVIVIGGFVWTYLTLQNQQQAIAALTVKVDALASQLTTIQQQNVMIRRNLLPKRGKKPTPTSTPGFGI